MSRENRRLKFLSQSVLLEEAGLPKLSIVVTLLIFCMVGSFIYWATVVKLEDTVSLAGVIVVQESGKYAVEMTVEPNMMAKFSLGNPLTVALAGVPEVSSLKGYVAQLESEPEQDGKGNYFYRGIAELESAPQGVIYTGMEAQVEIVVGEKSLMETLLSPVLKIGQNAF